MKQFLAVVLAAWAAAAPHVMAAEDPIRRHITVRGEASVTATPDRAEVIAGIVSRATTAAEALAANSAATRKLFAALAKHGIAARDMRTANFSVAPETDRRQRGAAPPRIVGYRVSNEVSVRLRDVARLGGLLDALVRAGANRLRGVRFSIGEPGPLADAARKKAMADAKRRAMLYAEAAGVRVGAVMAISERAVTIPGPRFIQEAAFRATAQVPVAPGERRVRATVTVTYAIE